MVDMGWNVWARENRRVKEEYRLKNTNTTDNLYNKGQTVPMGTEKPITKQYHDDPRTPPTGGSGVTQNTPTPVGNITFEHVIDYGQYYRAAPELPHQPVQILPPILYIDNRWKEELANLTEQVHNLKEWIQELQSEIEELKREKLDKHSKEHTLC